MQEYRADSETYYNQRIQLFNNKFISAMELGGEGGTFDLAWR